ncbi:MAG: hypothetical protein HONDAALG_03914 [Gammaproteobacteria bacterium]|nr:hypothetical protein [Gammaproteobacteria bacterium]
MLESGDNLASAYYDQLSIRAYQVPTGGLVFDPASPRLFRNHFKQSINRFIRSDEPAIEFPLVSTVCPYCKASLKLIKHIKTMEEDFDKLGLLEEPNSLLGCLEHCSNCMYWRWHYLRSEIGDRGILFDHDYRSHISKVLAFDETLPEGCLEEFTQYIRRSPMLWHTIDPRRLEKLVADIFKTNYGDSEVVHVGKPDDGGIDVLFIDSAKQKWLIQVKRREKPSSAEGISTVRNLLGTMLLENSSYGIVVSTADHFTYRAYEAIGRASECGMIIKLIDRGKLNRMLDPLLPDRPWMRIVEADFPDFVEYFSGKIPSSRQLLLFQEDAV